MDEQFYVESCGINDSKRVLSWLESLAPDRQEEVIQYIGNEKPHRMTRIFAEIHPTDEATQKQFFNIFEKFDLGQQMKILGSSFVRQTEYRLSNKGNWYTAERGRDIMLIPNVMAGNIKEYPNLLKLYLSILSELNESILFKALVKHDGALLRSLTSQISDAEALKGLLLIFNKLDRKNWEDLLKTGGSEMFLKSLAKLSQKLEIWEQVIEILQNELNECDAFALLMAHDGAFLRFLAESVEKTKNLDALKKFFPVIDEIEDNDKLHLPALLTANNEAFLISLAKFSADTDVRAQILKIFGQLDRIDATNLLSALKNRGFFMSLARLSQSSDDFRKIFEILESGSRDIYWWQYIMLEEDGKFLEILANSTEDPVVWADLLKSSIERVAHSGILLEANGGALRKIISRHIEGNSAIWCEILKMLERLSWREYGLETIKKILSLRNENGMPLKDHMLAHVPNEELLARLNKIILLINA
ncbi:MAG: hypothetical protein LBF94_01175 [Puniceicoccales bacterium]|nr:hypothetical protein [Puniceicoccales bacterium]